MGTLQSSASTNVEADTPLPLSPTSASSDLAEFHGPEVPDLDKPFWELITDTAAKYPDRDAVVSMWQTDWDLTDYKASTSQESENDAKGDEAGKAQTEGSQRTNAPGATPVRWTYAALVRRSELVATYLAAQGCKRGSTLVAFLWNSAEWALFFWACARLEMVYVPLDPRALAADVSGLLKAVSPAVVVVQDTEAAGKVDVSITDDMTTLSVKICCDEAAPDGWLSLPKIWGTMAQPASSTSEAPGNKPPAPIGGADTRFLIVFTSGTTSTPKGCPHAIGNLWSQTYDYDPNEPDYFDRWLVHTPVSHIFAVNNCLRAWRQGGAATFPSKAFDVTASLRALTEEKATFMSAVPTLIKALMAQPNFPGKDELALKFISLGGTVIRAEDIKFCKDATGAETAIQAFGMSEGAPIISWARPDPLLKDGLHEGGGVGRILPGCRMRICAPGTGPESRKPLKVGEVGELHIGGTSVITGYLGGVGADSFYVDHHGSWLITGDQARIDADGVLYMMGRYKDLIIRGGENIAPVKIELALSELPVMVSQLTLHFPHYTALGPRFRQIPAIASFDDIQTFVSGC